MAQRSLREGDLAARARLHLAAGADAGFFQPFRQFAGARSGITVDRCSLSGPSLDGQMPVRCAPSHVALRSGCCLVSYLGRLMMVTFHAGCTSAQLAMCLPG